MRRYHRDVFFPEDAPERLATFTASLNRLSWRYSRHCLDNANIRFIDVEKMLLHIKTLMLDSSTIFEYYEQENGTIEKAVYRIGYTEGIDIVLVINNVKNLVTIYTQEKNDLHYTLNRSLYCQG